MKTSDIGMDGLAINLAKTLDLPVPNSHIINETEVGV